MPVLPPACLGMLGGGQLGRMFVTAARTMGYRVIVLDPDPNSPAGSLANEHVNKAYDDTEGLDYLAQHCAVISTEFENIPATTLEYLAQKVPVHPSASALRVAQDRRLEKTFFRDCGLGTADFLEIAESSDIEKAVEFSFPAILKTATLGYDGKGQILCDSVEEVAAAFDAVNQVPCVLEQRVNLASEVSVVLARSQTGESSCFPLAQNTHANGILDVSVAPAEVSDELSAQAIDAATTIADRLDYIGVLAVEFFITAEGKLLVNEMAPRPHNSGHYTLDACDSSQFEQQVRMICGLAAGSCEQHTPVVMWNLLGDSWPAQGEPAWDRLLSLPQAKLHLYGKLQARPGRKMGHVNCLGESPEDAFALMEQVRNSL